MVKVVNMRTCNPPWGQEGDVRIDRATKWGNPYLITDAEPRDVVIDKYASYLKVVLGRELNIETIVGAKRLGCWCKPNQCHGDVLKKLIDEYNASFEGKQSRLF